MLLLPGAWSDLMILLLPVAWSNLIVDVVVSRRVSHQIVDVVVTRGMV